MFTHRTLGEFLAAKALVRSETCIATALERVYDPEWSLVLPTTGAVLANQDARRFMAELLCKNREDLLCRPFRLAVLTAADAPPGSLPDELTDGLFKLVCKLYFSESLNLSEDALPAAGFRWEIGCLWSNAWGKELSGISSHCLTTFRLRAMWHLTDGRRDRGMETTPFSPR